MAGALSRAGVEFAPGKVTHASVSGTKLQVWGVAPDEAILLYSPTVKLPDFTNASGVALVNVSSARSVLHLVGPDSRGVLGELCPVDLRPDAVADLQVVHAPVANVRVTLARHDMGQAPAFTILVPRDYAAYLWEAVLRTGAPFGLVPAGNHVMGGI
jgi:heterotetrameric sarcosine oxidase gamma subunit